MRNYWTCSKFADWLRGTAKPGAETAEGWSSWRKASKTSHPFRYWLAEEGLDHIQSFFMYIPDKIYSVKYYINNRWVTRTHALTAHPRDIPRGEWRDVGNRFLPCMFNELVDFVEVELAWWHIAWADKEAKAKYAAPFWATGWFRWRTWRCPQAGIDNLNWQAQLRYDEEWMDHDNPKFGKFTTQAENAQEIISLYTWWTTTYRNRPDPHDASGWTAYCDSIRKKEVEDGEDGLFWRAPKTDEEKAASSAALDKCHEIEAAYLKEDEEMMIRLIKIRQGLWT